MKVSQRLKEGRQKIKTGWCQGSFRRPFRRGNSYCALGALDINFDSGFYSFYSEFCNSDDDNVRKEALLALQSVLPGPWRFSDNVIGFNDSGGRTKDEIVALYDAAIELAELNEKLAGV